MGAKVTLRHRGPLVIEGDFEICDREGKPMDLGGAKKVKLCRCGHSKRAPICDGSHYKTDFEAELAPPTSSEND